jgi:RNA polymerase sigma factor (sigma-70 family)
VSVSLSVDGPGDAELISAVRGGDIDAYGELFSRHVDAARRLARQLAGSSDADDLVSDAFTKVLTVLQRGGGPDLAFRAYLLTAVRRLHVDRLRAGSRLRPVDDLEPFDPGLPFQDTAVEGFDNAAAARAFASLPERWQMVLWHTEVEQQKPADIAPLLGMSANSVSALAYRAREGLRQAFLSQHATDPDDVDCAWTRDHLGAYVRGGLSRRDASRVDDHLASCRACAAVYLELTEVNSGLAGLLAPLLLGTAGAGYLSSSGAAGSGVLSTTFTAAKTWVAAHASVTAVGGMVVAASAALTVYGAAHLGGGHGTDLGSAGQLDRPPVTSIQPSDGGNGNTPGGNEGPGRNDGPGRDVSSSPVTPTESAPPSSSPPLSDDSTAPVGPSTNATDEPTTPTDSPTDSPTGPTGPGADDVTFLSDPPVAPKFGDTYVVRATTPSGKDVTFTVAAAPSDACSLDADGHTVTFEHAGTCVVRAHVQSDARALVMRAGDNTQRIDIPKADQDITFAAPTDARVSADPQTVTATSSSGLHVHLEGDPNNDACVVDDNSVTYVHAQACTITASQDGNRDYRPAPDVTVAFDVEKGIQQVGFTSQPGSPRVAGTPYAVSADGGVTDDQIQYTSATPDVCQVDGDQVTFQHAQTCSITATRPGNADYEDGHATQSFTVAKGIQQIDFTSQPGSPRVAGTPYVVSAKGGATDDQIQYTSATPNVCQVDGDQVTFQHAQTCSITATRPGNADYEDGHATQSFTVAKGTQTIDFTPPTTPVVGGQDILTATSTTGATVAFDQGPSANGACTITGATVSFDHARNCTVTMSADGNDDYDAVQGFAATFTIAKGTPHLDFSLPDVAQVQGSDDLKATSESGGKITFGLGDGDQVCTLNQAHTVVKYHRVGTCVVTATVAATDDYEKTLVEQRVTIVGQLAIDPPVVKPDLGALLGYHHVQVTVHGVVSPATATLTAASGQTGDILAVGPECGSILFPARSCTVTGLTQTFDWYVNLHGAPWADVTFTAATTDGQNASRKVRVDAWSGER